MNRIGIGDDELVVFQQHGQTLVRRIARVLVDAGMKPGAGSHEAGNADEEEEGQPKDRPRTLCESKQPRQVKPRPATAA